MVRVKTFESGNIWGLENNINEFLKDMNSKQIIDIKYYTMSSGLPHTNEDDWNVLYTALVIYTNFMDELDNA